MEEEGIRGIIEITEITEITNLKTKDKTKVRTKAKVKVRVKPSPEDLATPPTHQSPVALAIIATELMLGSVWRR